MNELLSGLLELEKVITPTELRLVLTARYERIYGIRDADVPDPENYFPLVAFNPKEDYLNTNPLHEIERKFIAERVYHHTGISLDRFLDLPRVDIERYFKFCAELNKRETQAISALQAVSSPKGNKANTRSYSFTSGASHKPSRSI